MSDTAFKPDVPLTMTAAPQPTGVAIDPTTVPSKPALSSTTIQGGLVAMVTGGLVQFAPLILGLLKIPADQQPTVIAAFTAIGTVIAGVMVIVGRFTAKQPLH